MQKFWSCRGKAPGGLKKPIPYFCKKKTAYVSFQGNQCGSVGKAAEWKKHVQA